MDKKLSLDNLFSMDAWADYVDNVMLNSDVFAGLIGASVIGFIIVFGQKWVTWVYSMLLRRLTVTVELVNKDDSFNDLIRWFNAQDYARNTCRRMSISSIYDSKTGKSILMFTPGVGTHYFFWKKKLFKLDRTRAEAKGFSAPLETINLTCFTFDRGILQQFMDDVVRTTEMQECVPIYMWYNFWHRMSFRAKRTLDTIFLDRAFLGEMVSAVGKFLTDKEWYAARGIPYKLIMLFEGGPGTGKTSTAGALASHFDMPVYIVNINSVRDDDQLLTMFMNVRERSIILLEDIDGASAAKPRKKKPKDTSTADKDTSTAEDGGPPQKPEDDSDSQGVTISGLLNALDGIAYPEEVILIMTTNHADKLDSALTRDGRVDYRAVFELPTTEVIGRMFTAYFPDHASVADLFAEKHQGKTPAELQTIMKTAGDDPKGFFVL